MVVDLKLRKNCIVCGLDDQNEICFDCISHLPYLNNYCYKCGLSFSLDKNLLNICTYCLENPDKTTFNKFICLFSYQEPIKSLITSFKYQNNFINKKLLSSFLLDKILSSYDNENLPEVIIPVPCFGKRLKNRGYNQAFEIAKALGKKLNLPVDIDLVIKNKDTLSQVGLSRDDRLSNLHGSFVISNSKKNNYKYVAILDDVVTTTATISLVSKLLKQVGVIKIDIWTIAKKI